MFSRSFGSLAAADGMVTRRANGLAGRGVHLQTDGADAKFLLTGDDAAFLTAAGKPFDPSEKDQPVPGESIDGTNLDFVGNSMHHAASWTASDHELCILDKENNPVCHAQVAVAGSMILAEADLGHVSASTATSTFEVTGGTGSFQGVTGTIEVVQIDPSSHTSSSDVTITLKRP